MHSKAFTYYPPPTKHDDRHRRYKVKKNHGSYVHYLVGKAKVNESINHFNGKTGVLPSETIFRIKLF